MLSFFVKKLQHNSTNIDKNNVDGNVSEDLFSTKDTSDSTLSSLVSNLGDFPTPNVSPINKETSVFEESSTSSTDSSKSEDLSRWGISEEDIKSGKEILKHPGWTPFVREYLEKAELYRERAFKLLPYLDKSSRYSPAAMASFYQSIMRKIIRNDGDVFSNRIQLSKTEKILLAAYVYVRFRFIGL